MNELVKLQGNDIFTDSLVIAEGTGNEHESIVVMIKKYKSDFDEFGVVRFTDLKSGNPNGGRPTRIYQLNEQQATLLVTYLGNNEMVRKFKKDLVKQFFQMRKLLMERSTQIWIETRYQGKLTRKAETDTIKQLIAYAEKQGSQNANKLYMVYSKLANKTAGIQARDEASIMALNNLSLIENIILHTIGNGIQAEKSYKDIYQDCKIRLEAFKDIAYLTAV